MEVPVKKWLLPIHDKGHSVKKKNENNRRVGEVVEDRMININIFVKI